MREIRSAELRRAALALGGLLLILGATGACTETRRIVETSTAAAASGAPGVADVLNTRVTAGPASGVRANGTEAAAVTVTVRDAGGNPVAGQTVTLDVSGRDNVVAQPAGPTDAAGRATGSVASRKAEPKVVAALVTRTDGTSFYALDRPVVVFAGDAGSVTAGSSLLASDRAVAVADGLDRAGIRVFLRDASGNPVAGRTVTLTATGADARVTQPPPTDAAGFALGFVASTRSGAKNVSAAFDAGSGPVPLGQVAVDFVAGQPVKLGFLVQPQSRKPLIGLPALEVAVQDLYGNTVVSSTAAIRLSLEASATALLGTTERSAVAGVASFPGLSVAKLGRAHTIRAKADNLADALSARFDALVFEDPVRVSLGGGTAPTAIAAGDLDGANGPDLAVALASDAVHVLRNDGAAAFTAAAGSPYACVAAPASITVAAVDSDVNASPDAIAGSQFSTDLSPLLNDGTGVLTATTTAQVGPGTAERIRAADLDGGGRIDIAVVRGFSSQLAVVRGDGFGGFGPPIDVGFMGTLRDVEVADFNGDGLPDLAVVEDNFGIEVRLRNSASTDFAVNGFLAATGFFPVASQARRLRAGELDDQAGRDLAVAGRVSGSQSFLEVFPGDGTGSFNPLAQTYRSVQVAGGEVVALETGDLNGDGTADFALGFNQSGTYGLVLTGATGDLVNLTDATMTRLGSGFTTHGLAIADLNGDGRLDLAVIQQEATGGAVFILLQKP